MSYRSEEFDPENVGKDDVKKLGEIFEDFLDWRLSTMVIPDSISEAEKDIDESIKRFQKLIKKCKKGDMGVFKDLEEWNVIS